VPTCCEGSRAVWRVAPLAGMALRTLAWLSLLAAGAAEGPAPALRGVPAAPSAAAAAGAAPGDSTDPELVCQCAIATSECACTRPDSAHSLTAEDVEAERALTARAKKLSAWWARQDATTRLTRVWSGPVAEQTAEASGPVAEQTAEASGPVAQQTAEAEADSLDEITALWRAGGVWVGGGRRVRRGGCRRGGGCVCTWGACGCARGGGCRWR